MLVRDISDTRDPMLESTNANQVVVAELVEQLLPIQEVRGSNPKVILNNYLLSNCIEKTKIKKKDDWNS